MIRNVKTIVTILSAILVGEIALSSCTSCSDPLWTELSDSEVTQNTDFSGKLSVYMDASISMKGFVTVKNSEFNRDIPIILSDLRNKLAKKSGEDYYMVVDWNSTTKPHSTTYDQFKQQMIDPTGRDYTGQTTQVYSIIHQISSELKKGDVGVFITDGVLSEGFEKISNAKSDNTQFFGDLQREVKEALDVVYEHGLSMAIIRTTANYDGRYYCACNERSVPTFKDSVMTNRPYFYIMLGEDKELSKVLASFTLKDAEKLKVSYFCRNARKMVYSLAQTGYNAGLNSIEYPMVGDSIEDKTKLEIHLDLDGFDDGETPEVCLNIPTIEIGQLAVLDTLILNDGDNYFTIKKISKRECVEKVESYSKPSEDYWQHVGMCYLLKFKKSNEIRNSTNDRAECQLSFLYANPLTGSLYNIDNDMNKSLKELEGRTFGFAKFMESIKWSSFNLNMGDNDNRSKIATIKLNIIID